MKLTIIVDKYQRECRKGILMFSTLTSVKSSPIATISKIDTMRERRMNHPFMAIPAWESVARWPLSSIPWIDVEATAILPAAKTCTCWRVSYSYFITNFSSLLSCHTN